MKLFSLEHWRKDKKESNRTMDVEAAESENLDSSQVKEQVPIFTRQEMFDLSGAATVAVVMLFGTIFLAVFYFAPSHLLNPNPIRSVRINNTEGDYGFEQRSNNVSEITPAGSPEGKLEKEIEIGGPRADLVKALTAARDAKPVVIEKAPQVDFQQRFNSAMRITCWISFGAFAFAMLLIFTARTGTAKVVTLVRTNGDYGGITLLGRSIDEVTPGSPADLHQLKKDNVIVAINGVRTFLLSHSTIKELLETRDNEVKLAIDTSARARNGCLP